MSGPEPSPPASAPAPATVKNPRPVTLLLPAEDVAVLQRAAEARGMSLSELLGEAATVLVFEERLRALRPKVEQPAGGDGPPPGYV